MNRGMDRGRGIGLDEPFFLILARSSNSTRYFIFRKNSNSISLSTFLKIILLGLNRGLQYTEPAPRPLIQEYNILVQTLPPQIPLETVGFGDIWQNLRR
jgi:hypothetical protein